MGVVPLQPKEGEPACKENMEGNADIDREPQWEDHEKPVGRVKEGGLKSAKKRRPTKKVGVPKGEVPLFQFIEAELPPPDELAGHIPDAGKHPMARWVKKAIE